MKNQILDRLTKKAVRLVEKLQADITSGRKKIYENYGQKEIRRFEEKELNALKSGALSYAEICDIKEILFKVSSIH